MGFLFTLYGLTAPRLAHLCRQLTPFSIPVSSEAIHPRTVPSMFDNRSGNYPLPSDAASPPQIYVNRLKTNSDGAARIDRSLLSHRRLPETVGLFSHFWMTFHGAYIECLLQRWNQCNPCSGSPTRQGFSVSLLRRNPCTSSPTTPPTLPYLWESGTASKSAEGTIWKSVDGRPH